MCYIKVNNIHRGKKRLSYHVSSKGLLPGPCGSTSYRTCCREPPPPPLLAIAYCTCPRVLYVCVLMLYVHFLCVYIYSLFVYVSYRLYTFVRICRYLSSGRIFIFFYFFFGWMVVYAQAEGLLESASLASDSSYGRHQPGRQPQQP